MWASKLIVASGPGEREARAPDAERVEHRRDLVAAVGELVDLRGGGRRELALADDPVLLEVAQALARMFGLAWGRPARRSVKRLGPSSSSRTVISAQRSPRMSSARAIPHASPYVRDVLIRLLYPFVTYFATL